MITNKDVKVIAGKICISSSALYETLGIDESTLVRWGQKGCPKVGRGWWALKDVLEWRSASAREIKNQDDIEELTLAEKKTYFEAKLKESQLEATDLKNAISKGDYLLKTDVVSDLQRFAVIFKRSLLGLSRKVATELTAFVDKSEARKIEKLVSEIMINALEQLSINGVYEIKDAKKIKTT